MVLHNLYRKFKPVVIKGVNNDVSIKATLKDSKFTIIGSHNRIFIGDSCIINKCNVLLSGDNNTLIIDEKARLLGGAVITLDGNGTLHIGKNAGIRKVSFLAKDASIEIGELCMFSNDIIVRNHDSHKVINLEDGKISNLAQDIVLGRHVWIGQNVTILKGCNIGDDSILALGSVVTKSCPPNSIMAGNPAKIVKSGITWDY